MVVVEVLQQGSLEHGGGLPVVRHGLGGELGAGGAEPEAGGGMLKIAKKRLYLLRLETIFRITYKYYCEICVI